MISFSQKFNDLTIKVGKIERQVEAQQNRINNIPQTASNYTVPQMPPSYQFQQMNPQPTYASQQIIQQNFAYGHPMVRMQQQQHMIQQPQAVARQPIINRNNQSNSYPQNSNNNMIRMPQINFNMRSPEPPRKTTPSISSTKIQKVPSTGPPLSMSALDNINLEIQKNKTTTNSDSNNSKSPKNPDPNDTGNYLPPTP